MAKEILLYGGIFTSSAQSFINQLNDAGDSDVTIRMNTNGGDPQAAFGMIAKMQEIKGEVTIQVDGKAISSGFFMLPFADKVKALDVSAFLVHRAAFSNFFEKELMSDADRDTLKDINKGLRRALESKINQRKFKKITGVTFDEIFSMESRIDVPLTAEQAKAVGLVDEIVNLTESEIAASGKLLFPETDSYNPVYAEQEEEESGPINSKQEEQIGATNKQVKTSNMNKEKLKAEHPDVYASIQKDGKAEGISAEKDRVGAWMAFSEIDPKAVKEGVDSGENISETARSQFVVARINKMEVSAMGEGAAPNAPTSEAPTVEANKTAATDFEKELDKQMS